jgi:MarR family transcriptional regulator, temperature-dependent positive regulator of motility
METGRMIETSDSREAAAPRQVDVEIFAMPGHLLRRMHQASVAIFDTEIKTAGYDLTPVQYAALTTINASPGLDQARLASLIAYDRVTIGGVIDRLESKGLVRREIAKGDRRSRRLHLQPAGLKVLTQTTPIVHQVQVAMLAGLSAKENATLLRLLRKALDTVGDQTRATLKPANPR